MTIVPDPSVRCPHGNDFVWECPTCYRLLKEERDRYHAALLRISNNTESTTLALYAAEVLYHNQENT